MSTPRFIKNHEALVANGEQLEVRAYRDLLLRALDAATDAFMPENALHAHMSVDGQVLHVQGQKWYLPEFEHVYVVGAGKAAGSMAEAVEDILGEVITDGVVLTRPGNYHTKRITLVKLDSDSKESVRLRESKKLLGLAKKAGKGDLVISLFSGGGSSLFEVPLKGIAIAEIQKTNHLLQDAGASIEDINTVRKHLSQVKGGKFAEVIAPATGITLLLSNVAGDSVQVIASGPTTGDATTPRDALFILEKYFLNGKVPHVIAEVLQQGNDARAVLEVPYISNIVIGSNRLCLNVVARKLREHNIAVFEVTNQLRGEARDVGEAIARMVAARARHVLPTAFLFGGETTVTVTGKGKGGRNQELMLSLAAALAKAKFPHPYVALGFATDGHDATDEAAGAIIDHKTAERAAKAILSPERYLANNDSFTFFDRLGDLIVTGQTGTNVGDVIIVFIDPKP
ncbi:MAG: glycerate kinase [Parcubacteria group bacterium CG11_big_fil_rev_8_21_14_0_20_48_46]|nr:MAG: glycerate kinase [Parcubacteria group bacterium CG_4_8_14_3_um_filter_48_16]PIY78004.1 MAG: glycerate kinase [Parcubacteria group bacterium CG_4_10_14_0_8_um_filter_48_154]PIZ77121.1 MAG: glycerate kinase [bacterium CG_4_10_14_0_2_um_filter_48_144]PJC39782.1 MAG: glycerate kinase [Parcubacteria group bacterium CG_4_9_14_0_2_um_filter_48_40]PJE52411.1 MAG: glycerate kinase [Parcubacteria group bacterium CG11_big_fil_rev_8_21_14_0_20_48_46]